jgi:hypothetical protein
MADAAPGAPSLLDEVAAERARLAPIAAEAGLLEHELQDVQTRLHDMERSVSWRVTTPLRLVTWLVRERRAIVFRAALRARARLER